MTDDADLVSEIEALGGKLAEARASITRQFIGQERVVELVLSSILCGGHGLLGHAGVLADQLLAHGALAIGTTEDNDRRWIELFDLVGQGEGRHRLTIRRAEAKDARRACR